MPISQFDGLHIWTRYQSQYSLYVTSIARWDGTIVIKKKLPVEIAHCERKANDGCYYDISKPIKIPEITKIGIWHHVEITTQDDSKGSAAVKITLLIDGQKIIEGFDAGIRGPVYKTGSAGVRGDNTEFYFKNFIVDKL